MRLRNIDETVKKRRKFADVRGLIHVSMDMGERGCSEDGQRFP